MGVVHLHLAFKPLPKIVMSVGFRCARGIAPIVAGVTRFKRASA